MNKTEKIIQEGQTISGGWKKITLRQWGVSWPPKKGWKTQLIKKDALCNYNKQTNKIYFTLPEDLQKR
jgi:hypothetical protein